MNVKLRDAIFQAMMAEQGQHVREQATICLEAIEEANNTWDGCPPTWDGMMCWPSANPGELVSKSCPFYIVGFNPSSMATKKCMADGEWFVNVEKNRTWTNYTQCFNDRTSTVAIRFPDIGNVSQIGPYIPLIKNVSHVGYAISLATLLVAFCIFATFKMSHSVMDKLFNLFSRRLQCPRNKLHMHLFLSFMLRAFSTLLKDSLFVNEFGLASNFIEKDGKSYFVDQSEYSWQCKMIVSIWQYCIMANYCWILMEGMYLHNLIFFAVFSDTSSIFLYVISGWGLPLCFVIPWVLVRSFLEDTWCWTTNENPYYFQLIKGPTTASVLINVVLFLNIVRVLLSKLQASICEETRRFRYRKWTKSTLVLMPLFGVHYVVYQALSYVGIYGTGELVSIFIDQLFASFQGFLVAILYCLLNGEVRSEITRKWRHLTFWETRVDHRASLPLDIIPPEPPKRSYFGKLFGKRRRRVLSQERKFKRRSSGDTCLSTLMSSVAPDQPHHIHSHRPLSRPRSSTVSEIVSERISLDGETAFN